jgi:type IV secretory pathway VirB6-like protein
MRMLRGFLDFIRLVLLIGIRQRLYKYPQAVCSNCNIATSVECYAFQDISPYRYQMNDTSYNNENLEHSHVVHIPAHRTYLSNAAYDSTSAILQNASRLEELMNFDRSGPLLPDDRNDGIEEMTTAIDN